MQSLAKESQHFLSSSLVVGKAALACSTLHPQDVAARSGQDLEDLMQQAEDLHTRLLALQVGTTAKFPVCTIMSSRTAWHRFRLSSSHQLVSHKTGRSI